MEIPQNLDLAPFAAHSTNKSSSVNYSLYGISHHSGTLYGGHYIA